MLVDLCYVWGAISVKHRLEVVPNIWLLKILQDEYFSSETASVKFLLTSTSEFIKKKKI
jgi:hypothetical protein